jgi:D-glycero-D-manno-heptose 1,7-bisphosphate phosphatase
LDKPLVLLDRDGTLITEQDYLKDPRKVKLLPGALSALSRLSRAGFPLVLITNQSGVGRGLMTRQDVRRVHHRLESLLAKRGVHLDGIYWCPHAPNVRCACRKPKLKLVRQAAKDLKRSWRRSISVGDKWSDILLGQRSGGKGILVLTGYGKATRSSKGPHPKPDFVARGINDAVTWILKNKGV